MQDKQDYVNKNGAPNDIYRLKVERKNIEPQSRRERREKKRGQGQRNVQCSMFNEKKKKKTTENTSVRQGRRPSGDVPDRLRSDGENIEANGDFKLKEKCR